MLNLHPFKMFLTFASRIICVFLFTLFFSGGYGQKLQQLKTIIIDPGHGYPDIGAKGELTYESDVTLSIGLLLADAINKNFPEIKVLLTREDQYLPNNIQNSAEANRYRAEMANRNKGDLFISIHADSKANSYKKYKIGTRVIKSYSKGKNGKRIEKKKTVNVYKRELIPHTEKGSSIYILAAHKTKEKDGVIKDNLDLFIDDYENAKEFNSPELVAMASVWQKKFFKKSFLLASLLHEEFNRSKRVSHGVKQRGKGIWVLQATSMPSILVETGYICTKAEEEFINSKEGQDLIVEAIIRALKNYKKLIENNEYNIPKELLAQPYIPDYKLQDDSYGDSSKYFKPEDRKDKIYKEFTVQQRRIKVELLNSNNDDESLYSAFGNVVFLEKKRIDIKNPKTFYLEFDNDEDIDMTISADSLIGRNMGSIQITIYDGSNVQKSHVLLTNSENGAVIIKKIKKNEN